MCRGEKDWAQVEIRYFKQLREILKENGNPPLFVTGDIFHKWNAPPEVINRVIKHFPDCFAVPGNHDLPYHNYEDIRKSAFWTLVESGKVKLMPPGQSIRINGLTFVGFPFGHKPTKVPSMSEGGPHIAIIHAYCWAMGKSHPGAPEEQNAGVWANKLRGYQGLVFGDNHQAFYVPRDGKEPWVRNGGCFIRQSRSELDVKPSVGLIMRDGQCDWVELDTREDKILDTPDEEKEDLEGFGEVVEELLNLEKTHVDFPAAVRRAVSRVGPRVRRLVLEYMGEGK